MSMFTKLERLIAFRYLKAKGKGFISVISSISLIGIALGVATLIVVMAVMGGYRHEIITRMVGMNAHVTMMPFGKPLEHYQALVDQVKEFDNVEHVYPVITSQAMANSKRSTTGVYIKALHWKDIERMHFLRKSITIEDSGVFEEGTGVIIGYLLAHAMGLKIGDNITLLTPDITPTIVGMIPRLKEYRVIGTLEMGMHDFDQSIVLLPLDAAQLLLRKKESVTHLEVMLKDPYQLEGIMDHLRSAFEEGLYLSNWQSDNHNLIEALAVERSVMFLILSLIIMIAAFNIISSLVMLVNAKRSNIAILRTIGMTKGGIMRIFMLSGISVGVIGTFLGVVLGVGFAANIQGIRSFLESMTGVTLFDPVVYYLKDIPAIITLEDVVKSAGIALVLSFLATIYPAWRASRTQPASILRGE